MGWITDANARIENDRPEDEGSAHCSICGQTCMDPEQDGEGITLDDKPICIDCDMSGAGIE